MKPMKPSQARGERILNFFGVEHGERGDIDDMMLHAIVRLSSKQAKKQRAKHPYKVAAARML
jgi:hypothetical protein